MKHVRLCKDHHSVLFVKLNGCPPCEKATPVFKDLVEHSLKTELYHAYLVEANEHSELCKLLGVGRFPTILVHHTDAPQQFVVYNGDRTHEDILHFIATPNRHTEKWSVDVKIKLDTAGKLIPTGDSSDSDEDNADETTEVMKLIKSFRAFKPSKKSIVAVEAGAPFKAFKVSMAADSDDEMVKAFKVSRAAADSDEDIQPVRTFKTEAEARVFVDTLRMADKRKKKAERTVYVDL